MQTHYRSHHCGALRHDDLDATVRLAGWVNVVRNQGGVVFVDLRDRHGVTQVTFRGDRDAALLAQAETLRAEWVVQVEGRVLARPAEARNPQIPTGDVEVEATALHVLSEARTPPLPLDDRSEVGAETRLRHRYLDLRRARMTRNIEGRAKISAAVRAHFEAHGFLDIETPTLLRSTPEGARDYLVPSRVHPGTFYALPQSPQMLKQLLMIGGQDRYYQIARCYRDEDLRADRQPEFTQVDIEASFVDEADVHGWLESLFVQLVAEWRGHTLERPFRHMTYDEAQARFGSDKPDLRNPLELRDVTAEAGALGFKPFEAAVEAGGCVKALVGTGGGSLSRKQIEAFDAQAKSMGTPGVAWAKVTDEKATGPLGRFLVEDPGARFLAQAEAQSGDLLLVCAGTTAVVHRVLGALRGSLGETLEVVDHQRTEVLWLTEAPLLHWDEDGGRFAAEHHPFTAPRESDLETLFAAAAAGAEAWDVASLEGIRARSYDLVMDGEEVAGGSIRVHRQDVQEAIFTLLAFSPEERQARFGWFVEALQYGTPPHGGIAIGFDRLVALLLGESNLQEVIAFPKTLTASDLMSGAPAPVETQQLDDLRLALDPALEAPDESEGGAR